MGFIAGGLFIWMCSIWLAFPSGLLLARILYKNKISYLKFSLAFLIISFLTNCFIGLLFNNAKNPSFGALMIISVFQYLPVFVFSYTASNPEDNDEENNNEDPFYTSKY